MHETVKNLLNIQLKVKQKLQENNILEQPNIIAVSKTFKIDHINHLINLFNNFDEVRVYIRNFNSNKPLFVPENDINQNIWFHINKIDMQLFFEEEFNSQYYFVLLEPQIKFDNNPSLNLNNNHLNYAITWFLLSI